MRTRCDNPGVTVRLKPDTTDYLFFYVLFVFRYAYSFCVMPSSLQPTTPLPAVA